MPGFRTLFIILGGLVVIGVATTISYSQTADEHNKAGIRYMKEDKIKEAIIEFKEAIKMDPTLRVTKNRLKIAQKALRGDIKKEAAIHLFNAVDYADKNIDDSAITECKNALKIEPDCAEAHAFLGFIYASNKDVVDKGIAHLERAVEIDPQYADFHFTLGFVYIMEGKVNQGIAAYERAVEIDPDWVQARCALGTALLEQGMIDESITEFKRVLETDPNLAEAHYRLTLAYSKKKQYISARRHCETAERLGYSVPPETLESLKRRYVYDPTGKPDPFKSFIIPKMARVHRLTPLQRLEISQLTLVGIVWGDKVSKAMVQDPAGKGYILTSGTPVGTKGGTVKQILKGKVVIEEKTRDLLGRVKEKTVELTLRKPEEGIGYAP